MTGIQTPEEPAVPEPLATGTRAAQVAAARAAEAEAEAEARARHAQALADLRHDAEAARALAFSAAEAAAVAERAYADAKAAGEVGVAELERLRQAALLARREAGKADTQARRAERAAREAKSYAAESAEALRAWALQCEMKPRIDAALSLWKKMSEVDPEVFDANPWLLNVNNGTIDLRTGALGPHRSNNYITKLVALDYVPRGRAGEGGQGGAGEGGVGSGGRGARSALWEDRVLARVMGEADLPPEQRVLCGFLKRWFGYCATGSVREQCFAVHWGDGSNGKSTVMGTVARVLGGSGRDGYAATAAPGLLTDRRGEGDGRHPAEIADLKGRRLVTAHESGEGSVLREAFIKQATGGDRLKARYMHGDWFEFAPTHKLQLVTNHKPVIRGQDVGIWRRVLLIPYVVTFGTEDEVAAGTARYVKDKTVEAALESREESEAVLAWLVEGAREWYETGLRPPPAVLEASAAYRSESDRVRQYVAERCEVGPGFAEPLTDGSGSLSLRGGLYPDYQDWAKEAGTLPLSKQRFLAELHRVVPGLQTRESVTSGAGGRARRKILLVHGIRPLSE